MAGYKAEVQRLRFLNPIMESEVRKALETLSEPQAETFDYYICPICGYTHERNAPDKCPVCGTTGGRFERIS